MVCIYCGSETLVTNSRLQRRTNRTWRRRRCQKCGAIFSSLEQVVYEGSIAVQNSMSHIVPFSRDQLYVSIYEACKHRASAVTDASALSDTILGKLVPSHLNGLVQRDDIVHITEQVLRRFDTAAAVHYAAYHPSHPDTRLK